MKRISIIFWTVNGLMALFMGLGALLDVSQAPDAIKLINHLGYPTYFVAYIGTLKLLGVVAVLLPSVKARWKEWAYAGLTFDVVSALFSSVASGDGPAEWIGPILGILLVVGSYVIYRQKQTAQQSSSLYPSRQVPSQSG